MKFLVIFKPDPISESQKTQDHIIEADGFDRTDFDLLFWKWGRIGISKINTAIYRMDHIVCAVEMKDND